MTIEQSISIKASAAKVYEALTSAERFSEVTGAPAEISSDEGGTFLTFGGEINGRHIELVPGERIVQAPRTRTATIADGCIVAMGSKETELDEVASFIWAQIESPRTEEQIVAAIMDTYDIDEATAAKDVRDFLGELLDSDMAHPASGTPACTAPEGRWGWLTALIRRCRKAERPGSF